MISDTDPRPATSRWAGIDETAAPPGGDHPAVHLCILPGQLHAVGATAQEAVVRVHADAEARARDVRVHDGPHGRQQIVQERRIAAGFHLGPDGLHEPQARIDRVVGGSARESSGKSLGTRPSRTTRAKERRMVAASAPRPVVRHSSGRAIIVSRPQSLNQG